MSESAWRLLSFVERPNLFMTSLSLQVVANCNDWVQLVGQVHLDASDPSLGNLYFSGAPPGVDILLNNVYVLSDSLIQQVSALSLYQVCLHICCTPSYACYFCAQIEVLDGQVQASLDKAVDHLTFADL
jgi:hypothetical protein